eukprot:5768858-Pyramimonas_sp.AAC.1
MGSSGPPLPPLLSPSVPCAEVKGSAEIGFLRSCCKRGMALATQCDQLNNKSLRPNVAPRVIGGSDAGLVEKDE